MFEQNVVTKRFIEVFNSLKKNNVFKSDSAFAKSLDYTPQALHEIVKGRRDLPMNVLYDFVNQYDIDPRSILSNKEFTQKNENPIHTIVVDNTGNERCLLIDKKACAGYLAGLNDENFTKKLPAISLPPGLEHKSICGFQIQGDSMEPNVYDGDWVFCSLVEKLEWIRPDYVHLLVCEEGIVLKRIEEINLEKEYLILKSDNHRYNSYQVPLSEVKKVWFLEKSLNSRFPNHSDLQDKVNKLEKALLTVLSKEL